MSVRGKAEVKMNKEEVYEYLKERDIDFEITNHKAVYNMEEVAEIEMPHPEADAKNIFVRDDKKKNYYLITVCGDKRADLKKFRKEQETRPLTFASSSELEAVLGVIPGAVTPLGILNDNDLKVKFFLDKEFEKVGLIGVHPNENTATIWLKTQDLIKIIKEHGNTVKIIEV